MGGGIRRLKYVFISQSKHLEVDTGSVWNDGELWRITGIPEYVPTGKRFKVILEEVDSNTPFNTPVKDDKADEIASLKQKIKNLQSAIKDIIDF